MRSNIKFVAYQNLFYSFLHLFIAGENALSAAAAAAAAAGYLPQSIMAARDHPVSRSSVSQLSPFTLQKTTTRLTRSTEREDSSHYTDSTVGQHTTIQVQSTDRENTTHYNRSTEPEDATRQARSTDQEVTTRQVLSTGREDTTLSFHVDKETEMLRETNTTAAMSVESGTSTSIITTTNSTNTTTNSTNTNNSTVSTTAPEHWLATSTGNSSTESTRLEKSLNDGYEKKDDLKALLWIAKLSSPSCLLGIGLAILMEEVRQLERWDGNDDWKGKSFNGAAVESLIYSHSLVLKMHLWK